MAKNANNANEEGEFTMSTATFKELRKQRKLTMMGLARLANTTPAWLTFVEKYGHVPGPELRQRIADALGVTEAELWPQTVEVAPTTRCSDT